MQLANIAEGELVVSGKLAKLLRTDAKEIAWMIEFDESALKRRPSLHASGLKDVLAIYQNIYMN